MSTLKKGDKVRCVRGKTYSAKDKVVENNNYYVLEADTSCVRVNNKAPSCWWSKTHFKKVPSNSKKS